MRDGLVAGLVRTVSRFALIGAIGGLAAACSADALRFSETPFSNPFASNAEAEPPMTGSVDAPVRMPRSSVQSAPLAPLPAKVASAPVYNRPAPAPSHMTASNVVPGWRAEGGTTVTVGQNDTLTSLSDRYGVPANAILAANGIGARQVVPGSRVVIPVYSAAAARREVRQEAAAPVTSRVVSRERIAETRPVPAPQLRAEPVREARAHVRPGQPAMVAAPTPMRLVKGPEPVRTTAAEPRMTGSIEPKTRVRPGQAAEPAPVEKKLAEAKPKAVPAEKPAAIGKVVKSEPLAAPAKVAKIEPVAPAKVAKAEPAPAKSAKQETAAKSAPAKVAAVEPVKPEPAKAPAREVESTASLPTQPSAPSADFRWPAKGRVISGFGGGGANEGINIAVPDGTPVKAAEAGTVAYAGSEVKGYGNLVLIRHDNGYVSAYAHNGDVDVKRGQKVTRGQVIAKSGQSGNVTSPQLHFEIRKGSTPIDPMPYLASNN